MLYAGLISIWFRFNLDQDTGQAQIDFGPNVRIFSLEFKLEVQKLSGSSRERIRVSV